MLTSYDTLTAGIFEEAGVRALLVGDTSAELVLGYPDTVPVTMDELIPMVRAVVRGTRTALVVADLPFGSYQAGPQAALASAVRHLKEGGAQAVKLEGGRRVVPQVETLTGEGIPVMGHLGRHCAFPPWASGPGRCATPRSWSGRTQLRLTMARVRGSA